jgi:hypothetical protein
MQCPEHDPRAINLACKIIKGYVRPHRLIYLGDVINFDAISTHAKHEPDVSIKAELDSLQAVFKQFDKAAPCRKQLIYGNHERRWPKKLFSQIPELAELPPFSIREVLQLKRWNIEGPFERIELAGGKFLALHGDPYCGSAPGAVARKWIDREGRSGINGHIHRSCCVGKTLHDDTLRWYEGGSLCLNPQRWNRSQRQDWQQAIYWGLFGDTDFQVFPIDFHTNYSWIDPTGKEWRA